MRPLILAMAVISVAAALAPLRPATASPMLFIRYQHSATRLPDGRVLVTGGTASTGAEIYDPATDRWSLAEAMRIVRQGHGAVLLADGRVLVAGGSYTSQATEIYDPATNRWSLAAPLQILRISVALTTLADGRVLALGTGVDASIEIYDPGANTWSLGSPTPGGPYGASSTALTLRDGRVLAVGDGSNLISLYTPTTDRWAILAVEGAVPSGAAPLPDGSVLILARSLLTYAPIGLRFDPASDTLAPAAHPPCGQGGVPLTALSDGRVLLFGSEPYGYAGCQAIYDPASDRWTRARAPADQRYSLTMTELADGTVLLAGAVLSTETGTVTGGGSERYDPATALLDKGTYLPLLQSSYSYPGPTVYVTAWPTASATPTATVAVPTP